MMVVTVAVRKITFSFLSPMIEKPILRNKMVETKKPKILITNP